MPVAALLLVSACTAEPANDGDASTPSAPEPVPTAATIGAAPATDPEPPPAAGAGMAMKATGWLTIGADGAVQTTYLDPEGRYRDYRDGQPFARGEWARGPEGRLCFEPEAGRGTCWETGAADDDGSVIATDADGKTIRITRIAYLAPDGAPDGEIDRGG